MLCGKKAYVKRRLRALALLRFLSLALPGYLPPLLVCSPVAFGYLLAFVSEETVCWSCLREPLVFSGHQRFETEKECFVLERLMG